MKILLINSGHLNKITPRSIVKRFIPKISDHLKNFASLALPKKVLRLILGDFGTQEKRFPIGLGYLSAILKSRGHAVSLLDRFADPGKWIPEIHTFDFIGISASTPCFEDALWVLKRLEVEGYAGPIALGGPHTTPFPNTISPRINYVVQGEAEYIINDLVDGIHPDGITLRTQRIKDLDLLPRPDYDLFLDSQRSYQMTFPFSDRHPIFNMNTSRSCPNHCSFCSVRDIWGRLWTAQSAERIFEDMLYLKRKYNIAGIYFREDFFPADKKRVYELCKLLIKHKLNLVWACETRADRASDDDLVEVMARAGCKGFYIGAESGSQRMLNKYKKNITVDQIIKTCVLAKKYEIAVAMSLIVAHPSETRRDRIDTWKLVKNSDPEIIFLNAYREDVVRHGQNNFPNYKGRIIKDVTYKNGTWKVQSDRLRFAEDDDIDQHIFEGTPSNTVFQRFMTAENRRK